MRAVFDTNVLIDSFTDDNSAAAHLRDAAISQKLTALITRPIVAEYQKIMDRLLTKREQQQAMTRFVKSAELVQPKSSATQIDDPDDRKIITAANGGSANTIITSDRHLLDIGKIGSTAILRPTEAWARFQEETNDNTDWQNFIKNLGIGRK